MNSKNQILSNFPKIREALPPEYQAIYTKHYQENRGGQTTASSLAQKMEAWLHRKVAEDVKRHSSPISTLEIGAGTLNQLQYEPVSDAYDVVEPFRALYEGSPWLGRVRNIYADLKEVPSQHRYDRVTSIATFEHICNLPEVVARSAFLLKPSGTMRVSIPSEGTPLWKMGWAMTTGLEFRIRYGLDYGVIMRNEHVNDASEIAAVLRHFFEDVKFSCFGLAASISLYQFYECRRPRFDACTAYLDSLAP